MILHPGIIGLIFGAAICLMMLIYAALTGGLILKNWDFSSSSEFQLQLERKTYLVSTIVHWALLFQALSLILFVYTMEDIHGLFVGAMCATGSLNANPIGWFALLIKIVTLFLSSFWLALNSIDQKLENIPFVRLKYGFLFALIPLIITDFALVLAYFMGLEPAMITSCCGSLFGSSSMSAISTLSAFPVAEAMVSFYIAAAGYTLLNIFILRSRAGLFRVLTSVAGILFLFVGIGAVISFVSIYIYELPTHHCPFDLLQGNYNYIGYPIYFLLYLSVYYGVLPGLFCPLRNSPEVNILIGKEERRWVIRAVSSTLGLVFLVSYAVLSSNLNYFSP